jgi:hypothetical protein
MPLKFEPIPEGYRVYDGPHLKAIVTTKQNMAPDEVKDAIAANAVSADFAVAHGKGHGPVAWKAMPPASWMIHLTDPNISVDLFKAIAAGVPATA